MAMFENPAIKQYNNEEYGIYLVIYKLKQIVSNFKEKQELIDFQSALFNDQVMKMEFTNDITNPLFGGKIIFADINFNTLNRISGDGTCFIEIKIEKFNKKDPESIGEQEYVFQHMFTIVDCKQLEIKQNTGYYEVNFLTSNYFTLNNNIQYASNGKQKYSTIIADIINNSGLKFSNNRNVVINNEEQYISNTSFTTIDNVNFLLNAYTDNNVGIAFFIFDHIDNSYDIISFKNEIQKIKDGIISIPHSNKFFIPTDKNAGNAKNSAISISQTNYNNIDTMNLHKSIIFNQFNYLGRSWKQIKYEHSDVIDTVGIVQSYEYDISLKQQEYIKADINNFKKEYIVRNEQDFSKEMKKLFLLTNTIEFNCYGDFQRNVGQLIQLFPEADDKLSDKFSGIWYITRIFHIFENKFFKNIIQACRLDEKTVATISNIKINNIAQNE